MSEPINTDELTKEEQHVLAALSNLNAANEAVTVWRIHEKTPLSEDEVKAAILDLERKDIIGRGE